MSIENEDLSQSMAAKLTDSVGLAEDGSGDVPDSLAVDVEEFEQHQAEKDISVPDDLDDTRQGEADRAEEAEQSQQRGKKVPLAALHEERTKRQQAEQTIAQLQALLAQQQAAQQQAQQAQLQAQQEAAIPDFDEDPRGYIEAKEKQFAQQLLELQNGGQQPQQQQVQQLEAQVLQEAAVLGPVVDAAEARFEAVNPDYRQAVDHVWKTADANMRAQHPGISEQQLGMLRTASLVEFAKTCQAQNIDPAARIYESAQKLGFKPARAAPRREAPTSLSSLAGSARAPDERGAVTASDISSMSEKEFDTFWAQMKGGGSQGPAF